MRFTAVRLALVGAMLAVVVAAGAQQPPAQPAPQPNQDTTPFTGLAAGDSNFDPNQPIKGGFTLSLDVSSAAGREQDLSGTVPVDPAGNVQLKLVGAINVKGLTPAQAEDKIAAQLRPYIKDPKVAVSIVAVPKPVVLVTGAVARAGSVPVNDDTTLFDLVSAIGFNENADLSHVRVVHKDDQGNRVLREYNLLSWFKHVPGQAPDPAQNPTLGDRDYVYVSMKNLPGTGNVSVEGDVVRPGLVPIRVGVPTTLREALSLAGGPNLTADRRDVAVRRIGVERPIVVDYDKMEAGDPIHDIVLQADDVVYVEKLGPDRFVNMNGAFTRPGKLPYTQAMTLTQAIGDAGGLTPVAKPKGGRVFRHVGGSGDPTRTQVITFNYMRLRSNKEPDILLEPGDTVEIEAGEPSRPLDPFQVTTSLLTIALLVDRLFGGRSTTF